MTQVADAQVCPSDDVDQAWHLHITRTADYERFCREVLGRFLHHHPAGGEPGETARHAAMYAATLQHYKRVFLDDAPRSVWPAPAQRFDPPPPAPAAIRLRGAFAFGPFLALVGLAAICVLALVLNLLGALDATHETSGPAFLRIAGPVSIALVLLGWLSTAPFTGSSVRDTLDAYEAAWLAGDTARMATTAIGMLVERGCLTLQTTQERKGWRRKPTTRLVASAAPRIASLHPVELACLAAARDGTLSFKQAQAAVLPWAAWIRGRLIAAGLGNDGARLAPVRAAMALAVGAWLVVEIERIVHALGTPRPMEYLVMLTLVAVATFAGLTLRLRAANWRGRHALRVLGADLRNRRDQAEQRARRLHKEPFIAPHLLPMTLALLGPSVVLAQPLFAGLDQAIGPAGMRLANMNATNSGACSGGSGGDGGGGCGGGCGGGGCGG